MKTQYVRKLKICKCGLWVTTENALNMVQCDGLGVLLLYFSCPDCKSTMVLETPIKVGV